MGASPTRPTCLLVMPPSRRGSGHVALCIHGHRAHRAELLVGVQRVGWRGLAAAQPLAWPSWSSTAASGVFRAAHAAIVRGEPRSKSTRGQRFPGLPALAKGFGALAHEEHVLAVFHDTARRENRVAHAVHVWRWRPNAAWAPSMMDASNSCVAGAGEHGAVAGIEQGAVFQQAHGLGHGVQGAAATWPARLGRLSGWTPGRLRYSLFFLGRHGRAGHRAGATVNGNHGLNHRLPTPWISHGHHGTGSPQPAAATEFSAR